jgi:hypothetical protein
MTEAQLGRSHHFFATCLGLRRVLLVSLPILFPLLLFCQAAVVLVLLPTPSPFLPSAGISSALAPLTPCPAAATSPPGLSPR